MEDGRTFSPGARAWLVVALLRGLLALATVAVGLLTLLVDKATGRAVVREGLHELTRAGDAWHWAGEVDAPEEDKDPEDSK